VACQTNSEEIGAKIVQNQERNDAGEFAIPAQAGSVGDGSEANGRSERATAVLGRRRSVIVTGNGLTLDTFIATLQEALSKARRAKSYGLPLDGFLRMLRDMGPS
jgi:hypothetical protein